MLNTIKKVNSNNVVIKNKIIMSNKNGIGINLPPGF